MTSADDKAALQAVARPGFLSASRARVLPVFLGPVLVGSAASWTHAGRFSWGWFAVAFAGAAAGHLAFNMLHDVVDDAAGADDAARADLLSVPTSSGAISALYPRRRAFRTAIAVLGVAVACGIALAVARTPAVIWLGGTAFALGVASIAPPVRLGSRILAWTEAGAAVAGMLETAAAYAAQAGRLDLVGVRIGLVPGLLFAAVVYHAQFLRYRSDLAIGRPGTISRLGPHRATAASIVLILAPFAALVAQVVAGVWPAVALVALVAVIPQVLAWVRVQAEIGPLEHFLTLFGAVLGSSAVAGVLLALALVAERSIF